MRDRPDTPQPLQSFLFRRAESGSHLVTGTKRIRLDRLFVFYAGKTEGGCPTVDTIRFTKRDGTQRVRTTTYVDATGSTLNRREMLPLPNLAGRLLSKHPG